MSRQASTTAAAGPAVMPCVTRAAVMVVSTTRTPPAVMGTAAARRPMTYARVRSALYRGGSFARTSRGLEQLHGSGEIPDFSYLEPVAVHRRQLLGRNEEELCSVVAGRDRLLVHVAAASGTRSSGKPLNWQSAASTACSGSRTSSRSRPNRPRATSPIASARRSSGAPSSTTRTSWSPTTAIPSRSPAWSARMPRCAKRSIPMAGPGVDRVVDHLVVGAVSALA